MKSHALAGLYRKGDWLLFGAETTGLPEEVSRGAQKAPVHVALQTLNGMCEAVRSCHPEQRVSRTTL